MIPRQQIENNLDILGLNFPASRDNLLTLKNLFVQIIADLQQRVFLPEFFFGHKLLSSPSKSLLTVNSCWSWLCMYLMALIRAVVKDAPINHHHTIQHSHCDCTLEEEMRQSVNQPSINQSIIIRIWYWRNRLPSDLKHFPSKSPLKRKLNSHLLTNSL